MAGGVSIWEPAWKIRLAKAPCCGGGGATINTKLPQNYFDYLSVIAGFDGLRHVK